MNNSLEKMKTVGAHCRQGDVFIERVEDDAIENLPKNIEVKDVKNPILAYGEVTGHMHTVLAEAIIAEHGEETFFRISAEADVTHQEHDTHRLPPGTYKRTIQREYTPEKIVRVRD